MKVERKIVSGAELDRIIDYERQHSNARLLACSKMHGDQYRVTLQYPSIPRVPGITGWKRKVMTSVAED